MPLPSQISCEERVRLLLDYKRETEIYSTVVADLTRLIRLVTVEDYDKLFRTADLGHLLKTDRKKICNVHAATPRCCSKSCMWVRSEA
jgi:hypothetical protein